jgi:signal peptidase I
MAPKKNPLRSSQGGARSLFWAVLCALSLRAFVVEAFEISSGSMIPTLEVGDRALVGKYAYGARIPFSERSLVRWAEPKRGEVVVFSDPRQGIDLIKRVVAVGGDTVELRGDVLLVNGQPVPRRRVDGACRFEDRSAPGQPWTQERCEAWLETLGGHTYRTVYSPGHAPAYMPKVTVPAGHIFLLGDHRDNSGDSRYFGAVPSSRVRGRALSVFWSKGETFRWDRIGSTIR